MAGYANLTVIMGNLTRKPELRYTANDNAVTTLNVAVNRVYTDRKTGERVENTDFIPVSVWGNQAQNCVEYLDKGSGVYIEGRLNLRRWEGPDGDPRSKLEVVARRVQFLTFADSSGSSSGKRKDADEEVPTGFSEDMDNDEDDGKGEDIPF
ncbi:MAG: single-stranded DNA-binding protein [Elusimicrobiota bacterium]